MNINLYPKELAKIINAKLIHLSKNIKIKDFSTDTRTLKRGNIFWALKGKNFDGNDFVDEAIEKGAIGIISSKVSKNYKNTKFYLISEDTLLSLQKLAKFHYSKLKIKTVSITGSNGKTTTKEMIKDVLSSYKPTIFNKSNFNNEFGLPLSVLEADKKHKFGVFEIGTSNIGEVEKLSEIINPDIAVITTIAKEHMEFFKTIQNVFKAETEVIKNIKKGGYLVINGDNKFLKKLKNLKDLNIVSFGFEKNNDLVILNENNNYFFKYKKQTFPIKLKNDIKHNYLNAAAAFIVGEILKIPIPKIINALENFVSAPMRMEIINREKSIIILDAYNANPQSMELAIEEISKREPFGLILGDMKELGKHSKIEHLKIAKKIYKTKPNFIVMIGPEIKIAYDYLKSRVKNIKYYSSTDDAIDEIRKLIKNNPKTNILIKASRSMKFERFVR